VTVSFAVQKLFSLMQSHLFIVSLSCWAFCVLFRKLFPIPICSSVFPTASWSCFKVSGLILRSLIYFEFILVQGERQGSSFSLLHVMIMISTSHCKSQTQTKAWPTVVDFFKNTLARCWWLMPSYLGGQDLEDHHSRSVAQEKSSWDPISKITRAKWTGCLA
jgi:hypothetical protein